MPRKLKPLKVTKNQSIKRPPNKPKCKDHQAEMVFSGERLRWECTVPDCPVAAFPPHQEGQPIIGKGIPILLQYRIDEKSTAFFLKYDNNVLVPLSGIATSINTTSDSFNGTRIEVTLVLQEQQRFSEFGMTQ